MVNINAEILSYKSIGEIYIDTNVSDYDFNNDPEFLSSCAQSDPESTGELYKYYELNGCIYISTMANGNIFAIGCNEKYQGKYKSKLYAGIEMGELIKLSNDIRILNGTLIVDGDYGLSFVLPSPYDEIADYVEHIPLDIKLNEIYVSDYSFWNNKNK